MIKDKRIVGLGFLLLVLIWVIVGREHEDVTLSSSAAGNGNHPPKITQVEISPPAPYLDSVLTVQLQSEDPDRDQVTYRYRWFVNKQEVGDQPVLSLAGFRQNDLISVEVIPSDGKAEGAPAQSAAVKIGNNPPGVTLVKLLPGELKAGQAVHAEVQGFDREGDPIHYDYEWYINDQPVNGITGEDLDGTLIHSSDQILVKVIPSDPYSQGPPKLSSTAAVANQPPEITSLPPMEAENGKYIYHVIAKDPDGDILNYRLVEAPPGMSLNPSSGLLEWEMKSPPAENVAIKIQVEDAKGGRTIQQFTIRKG